jgi:hypothetical protein
LETYLRAHNDDPRVPVLINPSVLSTIPNIRFSGAPFDCCFISVVLLADPERNLFE